MGDAAVAWKLVTRVRGSGSVSALVAAIAFLPFARAMISGQSFFYRDLARQFFPLRRFILEGLLAGEVRYWNPYVHEGEPLTLLPISYPPDLLQALLPGEHGFSLLLALHVPLAALAFLALARGLGLPRLAAAGGAFVYSLGGFCLSSLNLYVHLQAVAWAPLVVLGLLRAARGGPRRWGQAALLTAVVLSTTGVEVAAQAFLFGIFLSLSRREPSRLLRLGVSLTLGLGLAGASVLVLRDLVASTARAGGLSTDMVLAFSLHPMTFVQVLIGGLFSDLSDYFNRFWGGLFFPGFPYFLSLYLGAAVFSLAVAGARYGGPLRWRIAFLVAAGALVCLGRLVRLDLVVDPLPLLRVFRFPAKAFFSVHLGVALLTSYGLGALLERQDRRPWRWVAGLGVGLGGLLAAAPLAPSAFPEATRWFLSGFFPRSVSWPRRLEQGRLILQDASMGGLLALTLGLIAILVLAGRLAPRRGALAAVAVVAADLLRTGAGLNPTVTPSFFRPSDEMSQVAASLRGEGGRIFTCDPVLTRAYIEARLAGVGTPEAWVPAAYLETLTPNFNMSVGLPSAYSQDVTMLVPVNRVLSPAMGVCANFGAIVDRIRAAGVAHVVSFDPLSHSALRLRTVVRPRQVAPLAIHVYSLEGPLPLRIVATNVRTAPDPATAEAWARDPGFQEAGGTVVEGPIPGTAGARGRLLSLAESPARMVLEVEADRSTVVVVRDAHAPGWTASVDGIPAPLLRADGRHRAVPIPAGRSRVELRYRPPHLIPGLALTALSGALVVLLWRRGDETAPLFGDPL